MLKLQSLPLMKCQNYHQRKLKYPCWAQPKLDGIRARYLVGSGIFISSDAKVFSPKVVAHMVEPLRQFNIPPDLVLDGEFYKHGWDLQRINSAVTPVRVFPNADTFEIQFYIFDWFSLNDPTKNGNYNFRLNLLITNKLPHVIETRSCIDEGQADAIHEIYGELGYEGTIYKMQDLDYLNIRSHYQLKRKFWEDGEFECVGVNKGLGKYLNTTGALLCRTSHGKEFAVSGMSDELRDAFFKNPPIGKLIKVKYKKKLSQDGIPQNPTYICVREGHM